MVAWYPYVPIGGEMGVNVAILSYNGTAYFGFTCDVQAVPDPEQLEKFVDTSFAELRSSSVTAARPPVEEQPTSPKRKRPNATIPLTHKPRVKARTKSQPKAKAAKATPAPVAVKKPVAGVSSETDQTQAEPITESVSADEVVPVTMAQ
jgi:hypothetical protein